MKKNERVWRELVDAAVIDNQRRWANVDDIAFRAGVSAPTAFYALRRLVEIGAITQHHAGFTVVNPEKVLTLLCAARSFRADALAVIPMSAERLDGLRKEWGRGLIAGGATAAIELLGGGNTVSDYSDWLLYLRDEADAPRLQDAIGREQSGQTVSESGAIVSVTFVLADPRAAREWSNHTSFAQTYADLFATPGWQATQFRRALKRILLDHVEAELVLT